MQSQSNGQFSQHQMENKNSPITKKPFYLQTWFISIFFALSIFIIPFIIGIVLLINQIVFEKKQNEKIKSIINNKENANQVITNADNDKNRIIAEAVDYKNKTIAETDNYKKEILEEADDYKNKIIAEADNYKEEIVEEANNYKNRIISEANKLKKESDRNLSQVQNEINRLTTEANVLKEEIAKLKSDTFVETNIDIPTNQSITPTLNSHQITQQTISSEPDTLNAIKYDKQIEIEESQKKKENNSAEFERLKKLCETIHKEYKDLLKKYRELSVEDDADEMVYILKECYRKLSVIETNIEYYNCYDKIDIYDEQEKICKKARTFINKYIKNEKESGLEKYEIDIDQFEDDLDFIFDYIDEKKWSLMDL